ncbi:carbohydrate ABC transporter permease [Yeguia hominis]|uniref:Sugar ABC transporter permease n=1 Tax=Yeguia hominis TaxID=2763662 RepID=A0A926D6X0_9FIRM|nr:sugar ABC transporter permease [Yeguia hominis]MBC8532494.1 sugar ABC transporter permease [Yeguia hominis]
MKRGLVCRPTKFEFVKFLFLPILVYLFAVVSPIFVGIYFSFTNWAGGKKIKLIGFENYATLVKDRDFWNAFLNNLQIIAICLVGQMLLGLIIAILLNSSYLRLRNVYRFVIFFPVILSGVVVGYLWLIVYNGQFGLLNAFLELIGRSDWIRMWLDDPKIVVNSISMTYVWQFVGLNVVIFLASLQNISPDILEAAELDGASGMKKVRYITMPLMMNTVKVAALLTISGNMKIFDQIWMMTRGGPGTASTVLAIHAYKMSFMGMKLGYGATISIGIMLLSLVLVLVFNVLLRSEKYE